MSSESSPSSPSKPVSALRNFRLVKKHEIGGSSNDASSNFSLVPGRKRIQMMSDSDSDDNATPKKFKLDISTKEKEERFIALSKLAPEYDTMDIQDSLVRKNWIVGDAIKYLSTSCRKKGNRTTNGGGVPSSKSNAVLYKPGKTGRPKTKEKKKYDSDDEYISRNSKDMVYDSDESENEGTNKMTSQRKKVYNFFNTSTLNELLTVKTCSDKKASAIMEMRPFNDWKDLVKKLAEHRTTNTDLLNSCQDLLNKQTNVINIMEKCKNMVDKLEKAIAEGGGVLEQPSILKKEFKLAEYQMMGLNWLAVMHSQNMNGILADEMGLGKTIQIIAFLAYLKEKNLAKATHLIVVPSSTLDNWENELSKWCPQLVVEKYYGSQVDRKAMRCSYVKNGFKNFDVILTTYNIVSSTPEDKKMFRICKLHYVIFDEAHMLKNMTTQRYNNLITINGERRILLTGTPLQNNLLELMSLLCFVMPSFFSKNIEDIKILFQKKAKTDESEKSQFEEGQVERAKRIMKPFVLRRLKKDVLQFMPKKSEVIKIVPMADYQKEKYQDIVDYFSSLKAGGEKVPGGEGSSIMMELRKMANHPLLHRHHFTDSRIMEFAKQLARTDAYKKTNSQYIFEELAVMSDYQVYQLCQKYGMDDVTIPDKLVETSGKFQVLDELLPKLKADGHRALIFSQFTMMLDIVETYLNIRGYSFCRLDGSTAVSERQDMINDFNSSDETFLFLLSTKAGGMGINLTSADTCIIHDIDFNPYNDKQAEDRCHRMGQTKPVTIYRLVSKGTIEEGMLMIANEKLKLEQEITEQKDDVQEHKSMVKLLQMVLGTDEKTASVLMTPSPKKGDALVKSKIKVDDCYTDF